MSSLATLSRTAAVTPLPARNLRRRQAGLATRDFDRVYRAPTRRLRSRHFLVLARPAGARPGRREESAQSQSSRWGISVKAQLGGAVVRNRIKRRLREILRRAELPPGWDVVVQAQSATVATADFAALRDELQDLLRRALSRGE